MNFTRILPITTLFLCMFVASSKASAQTVNLNDKDANVKGKLLVRTFLAPSIEGNKVGEDPIRRLTIYLPPGYDQSKQRYPVVYFLHGGFENPGDSTVQSWWHFETLMDSAIAKGYARPMILVLPNSNTKFGTSVYTNSTLTGNWTDFIARDVVEYIDKQFRTIAKRSARGLSGHSIGGHGALKIGMIYPEVFGVIYALSPGLLTWGGDFVIDDPVFKSMDSFKDQYSIAEIFNDIIKKKDFTKFRTKAMANLARAYSPDESASTFLRAKIPVKFVGDSMVVDHDIQDKWEANFPVNMIDSHLAALRSFVALKIDWGRNDEIPNVSIGSLQFSKKLETNKIKHFAEEYNGGHVEQIGGINGRISSELIPFFDKYLNFENR